MKNNQNRVIIDNQVIYFKSSENMKEIKSSSVQLIVTSPPYWDTKKYGEKGIGYKQTYDEYIESMNKIWKECLRVLRPNGKIAINFQPLPITASRNKFGRRVIKNIMWDVEKFMREHNLFLSSMFYWDKSEYINSVYWGSYPKPTNIGSNTSFEQIFVWVKSGKTRKIPKEVLEKSYLKKEEWRHWVVRCIWDDITPVIKYNSLGENIFGHSAPFPEEIPYRLIKMHTVEGETVLDPFLGSGTTLKVCRLFNRKGIGYEINEKYKELIISRIKEVWTPSLIENQYKIIGDNTFYEIFDSIINNTLLIYINNNNNCINKSENIKEIETKVLKIIHKKFSKIMTKSFCKKIKNKINKNV